MSTPLKQKLKPKKKLKLKKIVPQETPKRKYENLKDIMDLDRPFSMFYSGVEYKQYLDWVHEEGVNNFLISYEYAHSKTKEQLDEYRDMGLQFFIDSGAFTYQQDPKYAEYTPEQWEEQILEYLDWARENKDIIFAIANLDLERLVGEEVVLEWNKKYFEPFMLETGIPVCFIWHSPNGEEGWEKYCQRYPYVGFSWVSEGQDLDFNFGLSMLKVAEKHGAVVHGMGMTRTSLLPKLPFYSSDSTSWKAGLRYGMFSVWNGKNVRHYSPQEFDKALPFYKSYERKFDIKKIKAYDTETIVRASVYAFTLAEKNIHEKLAKLSYWRKPTKVNNRVDDLEFPSPEWVEGDTDYEGIREWAKKFNVNPDLEEEALIGYIIDITLFLNALNDDYVDLFEEFYPPEAIEGLHDFLLNKVASSLEEQIQDLIDFYTEVVEGKNDKLLLLGTDFDKTIKERDYYIEEEEYEFQDIPEDELVELISSSNLLPEPKEGEGAPEIDDLDEEIFSNLGVVAVRDEKGRFLKGQKQVRKPKKLYSDKFPKMFCNTCYSAQTCPEFKQGYVCAFHKMFNRFDTRKQDDILDAMHSMVDLNLGRLQRATLIEMTSGGGVPSGNVTQLIDQNMKLLTQMQQLHQNMPKEVIKQVRTVKSDGSVETTTQVSAESTNGGGNSILANLFSDFGKGDSDKEMDEDPMDMLEEHRRKDDAIEVECTPVEDDKENKTE